MGNFVKLTDQSQLPAENEAKEFKCGDKEVCVVNVDGTYSATDNVCLHRGGPLGQGMIANGKLICPWHAWAWDPQTGQSAHDRNVKLAVYPLKIENGEVMIEIENGQARS